MLIKRWLGSLVNRAVAFVILVIFLSALVVTIAGTLVSQSELETQAKAEVVTIASLVAGELDDKLAERLAILAEIADGLSMREDILQIRASILIRRETALRHLFDGFYLIGAEGRILAEYPEAFAQKGRDVSGREYFKRTSQQLTPVISQPYRSFYQDKPAIMTTAPIFDRSGRFIGMIAGAILLDADNFLGDVGRVRVGKTGYVKVATQSGFTLAHGRTGAVMEPVPARSSPMQQAMSGFEGVFASENGDDEQTIMAVKQMDHVPWFVAAVWPAKEAFAPAGRLLDNLLWVLLAVIVTLAPIAYVVFRRLMTPMDVLGRQITERHLGVRTTPVDVTGVREIRQVAETFNTVMEERDEVLSSLAEREAFFRSLTQSAPIGIVQTDVLGRIEFLNPAFEKITGSAGNGLLHKYLIAAVHEDDRENALEKWYSALRNHEVFRGRFRLLRGTSGGSVWADVMTAAIETPDRSLGTITVVRDITHELAVQQALREEQQRADSILGVLQEGVLMVDTGGVIRYANRAACSFLGNGDNCEDQNFFKRTIIESEERQWQATDFLAGEDFESLYVTLRNVRGQIYDIDLTMLHLRKGQQNERLVFVLRDDSERRRQEERLSWEATHDSLTQLLNRRAFSASLVKCLGQVNDQSSASVLMLIDLDYFKPINDEGGHLLGDDLLKRLADLLRDSVRQTDTVARLGGDEFGIILPACGLDRAEVLAEKIRAGVQAMRIEQDGRSFGVTTSIGLTGLSSGDSGPREVVARADEGCYIAKAQGRNKVVVVPVPGS
ncbi:diguanylate cyclase [uncultured Marinobacter sp.]|uniref:diguanylate cyclase domain-containing protein n=1 Tax=uncultured Marinobacter sp. TaxID=187379 RepID=UPI00344F812C